MFTGAKKKAYQREYMREYMRKQRAGLLTGGKPSQKVTIKAEPQSPSQSDGDVEPLKARIRELEAELARRQTVPVAKKSAASKSDPRNRIKHDVKFCGTIIWPHRSLQSATYPDLKAGWHLAHHWLRHLEHATPQKPNEILTAVMHLHQDIKAASSIDGLCDVMSSCIEAYAKRNGRKERADFSGCVPPGLAR